MLLADGIEPDRLGTLPDPCDLKTSLKDMVTSTQGKSSARKNFAVEKGKAGLKADRVIRVTWRLLDLAINGVAIDSRVANGRTVKRQDRHAWSIVLCCGRVMRFSACELCMERAECEWVWGSGLNCGPRRSAVLCSTLGKVQVHAP